MESSLIGTIIGGGTAGLVAFLLLALLGVLTKKWVPYYLYAAVEVKLARYEDLAFKAVTLAERASKDGAG